MYDDEEVIEVCEHCDTPIYEGEGENVIYDRNGIAMCMECAEEMCNKKENKK
jgi:hypothetical protein